MMKHAKGALQLGYARLFFCGDIAAVGFPGATLG
jgi:hypothetical protein